MKIYLFKMSPYIIFQTFIADLSLEHLATWKQSEHLIIVGTNTSHLNLFFHQIESSFAFVHSFLEAEES